MKLIYRHWYNIGLGVGALTLILLIMHWESLIFEQKIYTIFFIGMCLHQFEEFGKPGGFPYFMNAINHKSATPANFPLNQKTAFLINVIVGYPMYIIPIFFPQLTSLGMAGVTFAVVQAGQHSIAFNKQAGTKYNPGMITALFIFLPIGIYYYYMVFSNGWATVLDFVLGFIFDMGLAFIVFKQGVYKLLAKKDSPYAFTEEELARYKR